MKKYNKKKITKLKKETIQWKGNKGELNGIVFQKAEQQDPSECSIDAYTKNKEIYYFLSQEIWPDLATTSEDIENLNSFEKEAKKVYKEQSKIIKKFYKKYKRVIFLIEKHHKKIIG